MTMVNSGASTGMSPFQERIGELTVPIEVDPDTAHEILKQMSIDDQTLHHRRMMRWGSPTERRAMTSEDQHALFAVEGLHKVIGQ